MTDAVVEVGPVTVRGPQAVDDECAVAAVEFIDEDIALVDERPVPVQQLWRDLLLAAVGDGVVDRVVLVCPTWWLPQRVEVVTRAAHSIAAEVVVLHRSEVLDDGRPPPVVVEIAPEFIVVCRGDDVTAAVPRADDGGDLPKAVIHEVGSPDRVVIDVAHGVNGAASLAARIAEGLRRRGVAVTVAAEDLVLRVRRHRGLQNGDLVATAPVVCRRVPLTRTLGGVALSAALLVCTALFAESRDGPVPPDSQPTTLLVEGRVGVKVPAVWSVQRITSGPGSSRVQVVSPADAHTVLHITQARIPPQQTHESMTAVLRQALDEQPAGVFGDFNPAGQWAGRSVVTYRENRPDHEIDWVVLMDDGVRIGIGCQHRGGAEESVRYACDQAVGSAHAVF